MLTVILATILAWLFWLIVIRPAQQSKLMREYNRQQALLQTKLSAMSETQIARVYNYFRPEDTPPLTYDDLLGQVQVATNEARKRTKEEFRDPNKDNVVLSLTRTLAYTGNVEEALEVADQISELVH